MNMLYTVLINVIILLFPLIFNLFYCMYSTNLNKEQSMAILDFALLSSLYLLITYNRIDNNAIIILFNTPLIIAYIQRRHFVSIVLSLVIIFIYHRAGMNITLFVNEYLIYYILYLISCKNKNSFFLPAFIAVKTIFALLVNILYVETSHLIENLLMLIIFIIVTYLILYIYKKGEDIIKLHMSFKELEKDKQIKTSLFKITHEIKNPIAVCKSYLDMFDINNKEHDKYIVILKEEIQKILLLLQDFLSMNKIKVQKEILDINMLLEDMVDQFSPVLKDKNIKLKYNISQDEIFIDGDYNRLSQVLVNMIKNAIEALSSTKNPYISIDYEIDSNIFKIIIEDNGPGIAEEEMEKIKEPFYTTKKDGTGLGVSLSCEIIEAHEGTLNYISKVNEGTKVIITLPILSSL